VKSGDRFKQTVISTLAKRAANRCSNPDCNAITSGPSRKRTASVNVGEAAHIFGAHPGSARYDATMTSIDRADITNAIWLCGNCHKLIDSDVARYPTGLLFEWQKEHERMIAEQIGKAGAELRSKYQSRHLESLGKLSYLAERIVTEKGDHWEYRLTAEVLRSEMAPVLRRTRELERGLYIMPSRHIARGETLSWIQSKMAAMQGIAHAFSELMNEEFQRAWGEPGVAGIDIEIIATCRLFAEMCASALAWEEDVHFSTVDEVFEEMRTLLKGVAAIIISESAKVPEFVSGVFDAKSPSGVHSLNLVLDVPEGWVEQIGAATARAERNYIAELRRQA
jgi:hypothetical protein